MKRTSFSLFLAGCLLMAMPAFTNTEKAVGKANRGVEACTSAAHVKPVETDEKPRFAVISDTHFGKADANAKVAKTLDFLTKRQPRLDAVFVCGDITNDGKPEQYISLQETFAKHVPTNLPVYFMIATAHDHFSGENAEKFFAEHIKQPMNQYIVIKDYPFLTLSQGFNGYGETGKAWLKEHLAKAASEFPGKPIFLFMHVGLFGTNYGTSEGWGTDELADVLKGYPQLVLFSGHSHYPLGDPRSIWQGSFTAVNTGSQTFSEIENGFSEGRHPPGHLFVTEALIVTVEPRGDVELERWDTYRLEEIKPRWTIKAPHDGTAFTYHNRTGGRSPRFARKARPTIDDVYDGACTVTYPQAKDDEVVHHYLIEAVPTDGSATVTATEFSRFYLNSDMPDTLWYRLIGLQPGKIYTVKVTAIDSYNNRSKAIVSEKFESK